MTKLNRTFKRKGGARRRLNFTSKKRRVTRRGRRSTAFTVQSASGGGLRFKARKTSRRSYRKHLWDSTLFKEHYRSNGSITVVLATDPSPNTLSIISESALHSGVNPFYIAAGGARSPDPGFLLPLFNGDITLRGGMIGLRMCNTIDVTGATNSIQGTAFLVRTTKNWTSASVPTTVATGWDPTLIPDFDTRIGRIIYRKTFLLKDTDVAVIEYRLGVRKFDVTDLSLNYNNFVWIIAASNVDGSTARSLTYSKYWNVSFCGDAQ